MTFPCLALKKISWVWFGQCGSEMVAALWITELSSPFLHLRELLKELGYRDTDLNFAADVRSYKTSNCRGQIYSF